MYVLATKINVFEMANFKYASCIRIAGAPILPPLVTEKDREILALYKEKAIQKEKELAMLKTLSENYNSADKNDHEPLSGNNSDLDISDNSLETAKVMDFIRQALFDVGQSDVHFLQTKILEELQNIKTPMRSASCDTLHLLDDLSLSEDKVPSEQIMKSPSSYSGELAKLGQLEKSSPQEESSAFTGSYHLSHSEFKYDNGHDSKSPHNSSDVPNLSDVQTPPKLIRSNSYTLDSPSPSVLLYLKSLRKNHSETSASDIFNEKKVVRNLNDFWHLSGNQENDTLGKNIKTTSQSSSASSSFSICDNHKLPENTRDNNSDLLKVVSSADDVLEQDASIGRSKKDHSKVFTQTTFKLTAEKERAIVKIQAGIRGYLIRRLMKTNKVMELRNTIKDSLICALALHSEQNVSSADVNLHVRLIRQVTAACYELHAIFFEYTPQEKMNLISFDREKLLSAERAKMNLRRLKGIKSDDESSRNGYKNSVRGKPKPTRPSSLPLTKRRSSLNKSLR